MRTKLLLLLLLVQSLAYASSPEGLWLSTDEETGKERVIIKIEKVNGVLQARIMQVFKKQGDTGVCLKCPLPFKNKPVANMVFAWGMQPTKEGSWGNGHILDPKSGRVYRGKMTLQNDNELIVRGYLGISILGRSQVWERYNKPLSNGAKET